MLLLYTYSPYLFLQEYSGFQLIWAHLVKSMACQVLGEMFSSNLTQVQLRGKLFSEAAQWNVVAR